MATTRFRFSPESATALGVSADASPDDLTQRLGFPDGVKVTSVKADGDGLTLNLSGLDGGEVTGSFSVLVGGGVVFGGFEPVEQAAAAPTTTTEG